MNYKRLWSQLKQDARAMQEGEMATYISLEKHMIYLEMLEVGYEETIKARGGK